MKRQTWLDRAVVNLTAFASWDAMKAAMDAGYIPTLGGKRYDRLANALKFHGYRYHRA